MVWRTIADSEIDEASPGTESLMRQFSDNLEAIAAGSAGAPQIRADAIAIGTVNVSGSFTANDQVVELNLQPYSFFPNFYAPLNVGSQRPSVLITGAASAGGVDQPRCRLVSSSFVTMTFPQTYNVTYNFIQQNPTTQGYINLPDSFLARGVAPPNSTILALSNNPRAWAEGHPNAPRIRKTATERGTRSFSGTSGTTGATMPNIALTELSFFPVTFADNHTISPQLGAVEFNANTATATGTVGRFSLVRKVITPFVAPFDWVIRHEYMRSIGSTGVSYKPPLLTISNDPVTEALPESWRDNPIAIARNGSGAPEISRNAFEVGSRTVSGSVSSGNISTTISSNAASFFPMVSADKLGAGTAESQARNIAAGSVDLGTTNNSSFTLINITNFTVRFRYLNN